MLRLPALIIVLHLAVTAATAAPVTFTVAPQGNDRWSGRLAQAAPDGSDGPFATLQRAQEAVRDLKRRGLPGPVTVVVRGGIYDLERTLTFTPADSGTADCPITYQAARGEQVVLRGGRGVRGWTPVGDGLFRADLKAQGLAGISFHQLYFRGERQVLARYPNVDPKHPRTGGFLYVDDARDKARERFRYEEGVLPFDQWEDISQAEVFALYGGGWNVAITPILQVDRERRLITVRPVRSTFRRNNRFYIQNLFGALDAPGEWFLDRKTSLLYFRPPGGKVADGEVVVPVLDHLIEARGTIAYPHGYLNVSFKGAREEFPMPPAAAPDAPVQHLHFRGFRLEVARQDAVRLIGARHCTVTGNTIAHVGGVGVNLGGVANAYAEVGSPRVVPAQGVAGGVGGAGQDLLFNDPCQECRVAGNDIYAVGADGIFLYGTANVAENNHVYDVSLYDKDCAAINAFGERNVVRRNSLHDTPRNAIFLKGVDNLVELNDIRNTLLETCDGGAIRMCQRNLNLRGNIIRHNRILDTVGYGFANGEEAYQSPFFSWGIYLDDFTCGTTIQGNLIARTGRGSVHVHGGSDNVVEGNILVDAARYQYECNPIRDTPVTGNRVRRNIFAYRGDTPMLYGFAKWLDGAVTFEENLIWPASGRANIARQRKQEGWGDWQKAGMDRGSAIADPLFRNAAADDYQLRPGSPAEHLGFPSIPVERIGCYAGPARASWPLRTAFPLVREQPFLHVGKSRPLREGFEEDTLGRPPMAGDAVAEGKSAIRVTEETAAVGRRSVKFTDAPGLAQAWQPRLYYALSHKTGKARFAAYYRLDGKKPATVMVEPRQYTGAGASEYRTGPAFSLTPGGELVAAGKTLARVPMDTWFRVDLLMTLGENAPPHSELVLALPNAPVQRFVVPNGEGFRALERVVILCPANSEGNFYLDEVSCTPEE